MSKKRGRPIVENKKDRVIRFRTTKEEFNVFSSACEELGLDKSEMLRLAVVEFLSNRNIDISL